MTDNSGMENTSDIEELAKKLHEAYLIAVAWLKRDGDNGESGNFNPNAVNLFNELTEEQKYIDRHIAKILLTEGYRKLSPDSKCTHEWRQWNPIGDNHCAKCGLLIVNKYSPIAKQFPESSELVPFKKIIDHLNLSHDRMLYARDYFTNRMKNFPDNELGKTLSAIEEINKALELLSKFGTQQLKLVPLDKEKISSSINNIGFLQSDSVTALMEDKRIITKWASDYITEIIFSKYGSPYVPSLEDIASIIRGTPRDFPMFDPYIYRLTKAIHRLITNGGKNV